MTQPDIREEARAVLEAFDHRPAHAWHVARLARQLFRELAPVHGLSEREGLLLEAAALLHDLGRVTQGPGGEHHKESARLIRRHPWQGLTQAEVEIVALVARYHRKSPPDLSHTDFAVLAPSEQSVVTALAALLRIADALDRTHRQLISSLRVEPSLQEVIVHLIGSPDALEELVAARRKAQLAEKVFGRPFRFVLAPPGQAVSQPKEDRPIEAGASRGPTSPAGPEAEGAPVGPLGGPTAGRTSGPFTGPPPQAGPPTE